MGRSRPRPGRRKAEGGRRKKEGSFFRLPPSVFRPPRVTATVREARDARFQDRRRSSRREREPSRGRRAPPSGPEAHPCSVARKKFRAGWAGVAGGRPRRRSPVRPGGSDCGRTSPCYRSPFPRVEAGGVQPARLSPAGTTVRCHRALGWATGRFPLPGKARAWTVVRRPEGPSPTDAAGLAFMRHKPAAAAGFGPPTAGGHPERMAWPAILAGLRRLRTPARLRGRPAPGTACTTRSSSSWTGRPAGCINACRQPDDGCRMEIRIVGAPALAA